MYETRWATYNELSIVAECWYKMACEMGEIDRIPKPSHQRLEEVKNLFRKEFELGNLMFQVALDSDEKIVACAGGLIRREYAFPLAEEQSLFGWIIAVYTVKNHRNNGLASQLVEEICLWLKQKGAKRARLWSSSSGRSVYEQLGFHNMLDLAKPLS